MSLRAGTIRFKMNGPKTRARMQLVSFMQTQIDEIENLQTWRRSEVLAHSGGFAALQPFLDV